MPAPKYPISSSYATASQRWRQPLCIGNLWLQTWLLATTVCVASAAHAQGEADANADALTDHVLGLRVAGPDGSVAVVAAYYFDQQAAVRSSTQLVVLSETGTQIELDSPGAGLAIQIISPVTQAIEAQLLIDGQAVVMDSENGTVPLELMLGVVPADWAAPSLDIRLEAADKQLIEAFREGLVSEQVEELISQRVDADVDAASLVAGVKALKQNLGPLLARADDLPQWLGWDAAEGGRVLCGTLEFERGTCRFRLDAIDDKLIEVEFSSAQMSPWWFTQQVETEAYEAEAVALAEALFQDKPETAHDLFSSLFHDTITVERLDELGVGLREQFGNKIITADLKLAQLGPIDDVNMQRTLSIVHSYRMDSEKECVSRVDFVFPLNDGRIPRAHLARINIRLAWQSSAPQQVAVAGEALELLCNPSFDANRFSSLLAPEILELTETSQLVELLGSLSKPLEGLAAPVDWDLWSVTTTGRYCHAVGQIQLVEAQTAEAWIDFVDDKLSAVTIISPQVAFTTRQCISRQTQIQQACRAFWHPLLAGDAKAAYQLLSPDLQTQLSQLEFELIAASSDLSMLDEPGKLRVASILVSDSLVRTQAAAVVCYCVAAFPNAQFQPLRCELAFDASGEPKVIDFTSDFAATVPVQPTPERLAPLRALTSGNTANIIPMLAEQEKLNTDYDVLSAFANKLHRLLGNDWKAEDVRILHQYSVGRRVEQLLGNVSYKDQLPIPFTIITEFGMLKSFHFASEKLNAFVDERILKIWAQQRGLRFLNAWLAGPGQDTVLMSQHLDSELGEEEGLLRFNTLRDSLTEQHGAFSGPVLSKIQIDVRPLQVVVECPVNFRASEVKLRIKLDLDATSLRVSSVQVVSE